MSDAPSHHAVERKKRKLADSPKVACKTSIQTTSIGVDEGERITEENHMTTQHCPKCNYEWESRPNNPHPKACPRCKTRLDYFKNPTEE
jgi:rubrerythrin